MAKPPIVTEGPFLRADSCLTLVRRLLVLGLGIALPLSFLAGLVVGHLGACK